MGQEGELPVAAETATQRLLPAPFGIILGYHKDSASSPLPIAASTYEMPGRRTQSVQGGAFAPRDMI